MNDFPPPDDTNYFNLWFNSTQVSRADYNPKTCVLRITYKTGKMYQYDQVPVTVYHELIGADSPGKYIAANIKGKFEYHEIIN